LGLRVFHHPFGVDQRGGNGIYRNPSFASKVV